jgi:hypothetical protein
MKPPFFVIKFLSVFLFFFALTIDAAQAMPHGTPPANTLKEIQAQIDRCIQNSSLPALLPDMQVTARFALKRDGHLIGSPRITFVSAQANDQTRVLYGQSLTQALQKCAPFVLTSGLGGAIAGRPGTYRVIFVGSPPKMPSL